jgi:hypothetical protein
MPAIQRRLSGSVYMESVASKEGMSMKVGNAVPNYGLVRPMRAFSSDVPALSSVSVIRQPVAGAFQMSS